MGVVVSHTVPGLRSTTTCGRFVWREVGEENSVEVARHHVRNARGQFAFLCNIPFATTATRLDTHAAWNVGETILMIPAVHQFLRRTDRLRRTDEPSAEPPADVDPQLAHA